MRIQPFLGLAGKMATQFFLNLLPIFFLRAKSFFKIANQLPAVLIALAFYFQCPLGKFYRRTIPSITDF